MRFGAINISTKGFWPCPHPQSRGIATPIWLCWTEIQISKYRLTGKPIENIHCSDWCKKTVQYIMKHSVTSHMWPALGVYLPVEIHNQPWRNTQNYLAFRLQICVVNNNILIIVNILRFYRSKKLGLKWAMLKSATGCPKNVCNRCLPNFSG